MATSADLARLDDSNERKESNGVSRVLSNTYPSSKRHFGVPGPVRTNSKRTGRAPRRCWSASARKEGFAMATCAWSAKKAPSWHQTLRENWYAAPVLKVHFKMPRGNGNAFHAPSTRSAQRPGWWPPRSAKSVQYDPVPFSTTNGSLGVDNVTGCLCQPGRYRAGKQTCAPCPGEAECSAPETITTTLRTKATFWRSTPYSTTFHRCPFETHCVGGLFGSQCREGHGGIVCATCRPEFVFQGEACVPCPGRTGSHDFSWELLGVCVVGFVLLGGAAYVFLTEPALTKQDMDRLKLALKHVQLEKDQVRRNTFCHWWRRATAP